MSSQRDSEVDDVSPSVRLLVDRVGGALDAIAEDAVQRVWAEVPAYSTSPDPKMRRDLLDHSAKVFAAILSALGEGRPANAADFPITPVHATRRSRQGISLDDAMRAFRLAHLTLWKAVVDAAGNDPGLRETALALTTSILTSIDVVSSSAAQAYLEAQRHDLAEEDRVHRDVLEDLLAGREPTTGPQLSAMNAAGLTPTCRFLVVSAIAATTLPDRHSLRDALKLFRASFVETSPGLAVVRHDEIIGIAPMSTPRRTIERLRHVQAKLADDRLRFAVGVSTAHANLAAVPVAYSEARDAREGLGSQHGVMALPDLTTFEYIMLRSDRTARRLIEPDLRAFVEHDRSRGSQLIKTFLAYVANDLNARATAAELHMHPNTAYYRLDRIAERTKCDLRSFRDVLQLLMAIRLSEQFPERSGLTPSSPGDVDECPPQ